MRFFKFAMVAALLPLLAACAAGPDTNMTAMMKAPGDPFLAALHKEYVALAAAENEEWDTQDAIFFNNKAKAAAEGKDEGPQAISERNISGAPAAEIEAASYALMPNLLGGGKQWAPAEMARAQAMYDCWLQEQEEGDQPAHIEVCRSAFNEAINKVEAMRPAPQAAAAPMKKEMPLPEPFTVYFDFDSFDLSATASAVIKAAAKAAADSGAKGVMVSGHTDSKGNWDYNEGLARARAAAVANQLMVEGVSRGMISRTYMAEADQEVPTKDGVKEARNRRVIISFSR